MTASPLSLGPRRVRGFTLIELMVVVAIIGILAAVAYPSYLGSVRAGRRADAQAVLMAAAQYLQRHYAAVGTFSGASLETAHLDMAPKDTSAASKTYSIGLTLGDGSQAYELTATPVEADPLCGSLTLSHTGAKGVTQPGATVASCWR